MDKRYQIFISSTYADLKDERSRVIQTVMEMDCIPAGMEIFPAIDEEQFNFIKKIIDDCDYYVLIVGGRYGSLSNDGLSYTEKEFDYACEKGIKVIAFLHKDPNQISLEKSDIEPEIRLKLENFRTKVSTQRLVKYWENAKELPGLVALSLPKTIKTYPATGWVRATNATSSEVLSELNELRKRNEKLIEENLTLRKQNELVQNNKIEGLAGFEDELEVKIKTLNNNHTIKMSWGEIFYIMSPYLLENPNNKAVKSYLSLEILKYKDKQEPFPEINEDLFQTIKVQFESLGLIELKYSKTTRGGKALFWILTKLGKSKMTELRSVKR